MLRQHIDFWIQQELSMWFGIVREYTEREDNKQRRT